MRRTGHLYLAALIAALATGCGGREYEATEKKVELLPAPVFNADTAFALVERQVAFGPRVPGSDAHRACGDWLVARLKAAGASVTEQTGTVPHMDGKELPMRNIIGAFNPSAKKRILLCAHWDTRPWADQDSTAKEQPIDGANDGGSGTGVLLEVARLLGQRQPAVGVDIVLFDVEDQGRPEFDPDTLDPEHHFCLGSRHWATNPHVPGYRAQYGILLDMVGATGAVYTMEGVSQASAPAVLKHVWDVASALGLSERFSYRKTRPIIDDHTYINQLAQIPTIDIIEYDVTTATSFNRHWHTHRDGIGIIDRSSLRAVGQTVVQVVYNER